MAGLTTPTSQKMFLTKLGNAFFLLTIAMVESESPSYECCTEKMVGGVSYTLFHDVFHGPISHQCLNDCVYTRTGTSSPKFCFGRGWRIGCCMSLVFVSYSCCICALLISYLYVVLLYILSTPQVISQLSACLSYQVRF